MSDANKVKSPHRSGHRGHHPQSQHQNRRGQGSYHRGNRGRGHQQRFSPEQIEVDALFNKSFTFQKADDPWRLPPREEMFTAPESTLQDGWNQALVDLRSKLRSTQDHLSDKEILEWHSHTSSTHRGGLVIPELKKRFHVELGTQAWCKFHEIVATRHLIPDSAFASGTLHSLHICEAPGAFISSLNHYIKTHRDKELPQWKWLGTSLNPHCETNTPDCTIVDDRLILQTPDCWYFGEDNTGDVMSATNLAGLERLVEQKMNGHVHLVTADGSVNCQNDPKHQEHRVFPLLFCQSLTALQILSPGGAFLIKMFTMYNANTACLMYLLNCTFEEVTVVKPACSKAGNSEVYVICKSFLGRAQLKPQLETLLKHFGPDVGNASFFDPANLPHSFVTQLEKCSQKFTSYQIAAIEENLSLYPKIDESSRRCIDKVRELCVETFIRRCRLRAARKHQKLMPNYGSKTCSMFSKNIWHRLHGSLEDREEEGHRSWRDRLLAIQRSLLQTGAKGDPGGDRKGSSPKKMRSSGPAHHHQDGGMLDSVLGANDNGLGESHGGPDFGRVGPGLSSPTSQKDPKISMVCCHGDGGHVGTGESAAESCEYKLSESVGASSAETNIGAIQSIGSCGDTYSIGMDESAMEKLEYQHGASNSVEVSPAQKRTQPANCKRGDSQMMAYECMHAFSKSVQTSSAQTNISATQTVNCHVQTDHLGLDQSAMETCNHEQILNVQTRNGVAGIVGEVATMDVGSSAISRDSFSECATSCADDVGCAGVNHSNSTLTAKMQCDSSITNAKAMDQNSTLSSSCDSHTAGGKSCHGKSSQGLHENGNGSKLSADMSRVEIPWITPGKHDFDSLGCWKIVKGKPLRVVFMSSFCQMQVLDKWRTVRMNAKVLQSSGHYVKGCQNSDLSPQIRKVIEDQISKRPSSTQEEWYYYGLESEEVNTLHELAASHRAVVVGSNLDGDLSTDMAKDPEGMKQRNGDEERRFKSLFIKLLPPGNSDDNEPTAAELKIKMDFISSCLLAMKNLQRAGSLHLWLPALLTRFSASIIYALSQTFNLLTLDRGQRSDELATPPVLVSGTGFHPNQQMQKNIQRVYDEMKELQEDGSHDVLQFIPMSSLFNPDFDKPLTRFNESLLTEDVLHVVKAELSLLDDEKA